MTQTVKGSAWEAVTNVIVGYTINFCANALILPLLGVPMPLEVNVTFGVILTVISLARSFILRRIFTRIKGQHTSEAPGAKP